MKQISTLLLLLLSIVSFAQDLSLGYIANDLQAHPMQAISPPAYLDFIYDPSFPSTKITRISDAGPENFAVPMYSTIQAWNADETYMIIYGNPGGHQLLNGTDYSFVRYLSDFSPSDVEQIFWHYTDPEILFYPELGTGNFFRYNVNTMEKTVIADFSALTNCNSEIAYGSDIQMMSWDSDVISFRCGNSASYYYRISTEELTQFDISDIGDTAPMPFPSGDLFYHRNSVYNSDGNHVLDFNLNNVEHSCLGKLSNGDDAYFAIAFEEGPNGGCQGTLVAHNATNGNCFPVASTEDYGYPQSGTHISAGAHKNTLGGWVAVSMMGFDLDGQDLLDQEIFVARVHESSADIYRVAHHRSDENEFDYWGEPHVTISPSGTRLLFGSDWSGADDGISVEAYVAELPAFTTVSTSDFDFRSFEVFPNPTSNIITIKNGWEIEAYKIYSLDGKVLLQSNLNEANSIDIENLSNGIYILTLRSREGVQALKFVKQNILK